MRTLLILTLAVGSSALAAPVPKELKIQYDAQRIEGLWKEETGTRWYFDGEKLFAGGTDTAENKGHEYNVVLRSDRAMREFDLGNMGTVQFSGIYEFLDGELRFTYRSGNDRPRDFTAAPGKYSHGLKRFSGSDK